MKSVSAVKGRLARWFRRADAIHPYVQYLQEVAANSSIIALRARALEQLHLEVGDQVLDLGCGPGTVTVQIAAYVGPAGRVQGIDIDPQMINAANELAAQKQLTGRVQHQVDDCAHLSFEDNRFDACYCERVFQHLPGDAPLRTAKEILRILKPGGRFVVVDTDWLSATIDVCDGAIGRRVTETWARRLPNPDAGARLTHWFSGVGSSELQVHSLTMSLLPSGPTGALFMTTAERTLESQELMQWSAGLAAAQKNHLPLGRINMIMLSGVKPGNGST